MNTKTLAMGSCALAALAITTGAHAQAPAAPLAAPKATTSTSSDPGQQPVQTSQDTQASSASSVAEIVVTASKRATTVQNVPIAISAYSDVRRNLLGIEDSKDITNYTPSMSLNGEFLSLRGVGRYTDALGTDPGVAVYVDGVYTNSPDYLNQPDFLADRIEVLAGPQSTYGRNAIGGAINVISKRPTDDFYAEARSGLTNYLDTYTDLVVSGPITNQLKYRLSYSFSDQFDGVREEHRARLPRHKRRELPADRRSVGV